VGLTQLYVMTHETAQMPCHCLRHAALSTQHSSPCIHMMLLCCCASGRTRPWLLPQAVVMCRHQGLCGCMCRADSQETFVLARRFSFAATINWSPGRHSSAAGATGPRP